MALIARPGVDQTFRPCILFTMKGEGIVKMGFLTGNNILRKMAIIFDNVVLSAPVIQKKLRRLSIADIPAYVADRVIDVAVGDSEIKKPI